MRFHKMTDVLSDAPKFEWQKPGVVTRECKAYCKRKKRHYGPCLRFTLDDVQKQPRGSGVWLLYMPKVPEHAFKMLRYLQDISLEQIGLAPSSLGKEANDKLWDRARGGES